MHAVLGVRLRRPTRIEGDPRSRKDGPRRIKKPPVSRRDRDDVSAKGLKGEKAAKGELLQAVAFFRRESPPAHDEGASRRKNVLNGGLASSSTRDGMP